MKEDLFKKAREPGSPEKQASVTRQVIESYAEAQGNAVQRGPGVGMVLEEAIGSARRISPCNRTRNVLYQTGLMRTTHPFHTVLLSSLCMTAA